MERHQKPILQQVAEWQKARPVVRSASLQSAKIHTLIWETDAHNGVAVIEKVGDERRGHFVGFRIEQQSFGRVVGNLKRRRTLEAKKSGALC